ncbi:MAG: hypothetical protein RH982_12805 [Parvibaculum sp.]
MFLADFNPLTWTSLFTDRLRCNPRCTLRARAVLAALHRFRARAAHQKSAASADKTLRSLTRTNQAYIACVEINRFDHAFHDMHGRPFRINRHGELGALHDRRQIWRFDLKVLTILLLDLKKYSARALKNARHDSAIAFRRDGDGAVRRHND